VGIRYVGSLRALQSPDLLILPGTKNTMADLLWMRQNGLADAVVRIAAQGTPVFGICGGYQMLGISIADPCIVEHGGEMSGLGLLPIETVFEQEKTRTKVSGAFAALTGPLAQLSSEQIEGYEIHMGITKPAGSEPGSLKPFSNVVNTITGEMSDGGVFRENVYGCYLHGVFDASAQCLVKTLCTGKGIAYQTEATEHFKTYKERQYDLLAESLRTHIDMQAVYAILEGGI
jgi:adenosylcobyric acid synthase